MINRTISGLAILSAMTLLGGAGCGKSAAKTQAAPCDAKTIAELAANLDKANGIGVDLTDEKVKADIATAKAAITGKHLAFTGCAFHSQGNDVVSFAEAGGAGPSIDCTMKGGAQSVTEFRHAAMRIGQDKLKLDVSGDVGMGGMKGFERLGLVSCVIAVTIEPCHWWCTGYTINMEILVPARGRPYLDGDSLDLSTPLVFTVRDVLSAGECGTLVERIEALGPSAAPITTSRGFVMRPDIRNNERVIFDDLELARTLFTRVAPAIPTQMCGMRAVGANERFRCYRYTRGQRFAPHYDGAFVRDECERSLLTLMVYLNEGFTGGTTAFLDEGIAVTPRTGMALLFQHAQLHEGAEVHSGTKYALRSDVMFRAA